MSRPGRNLRVRLLLLLGLVACASCSSSDRSEDVGTESGPYVVATLPVVAHLVRPVAGPSIPVRVLIDRAVSPHAYELRPSQAGLVAGAAGVFAASRGVDGWIGSYSDEHVFRLFEGAGHGWADPVLAADAVRSVGSHLCELFPDDCAGFQRRAASYSDSLGRLTDDLGPRLGRVRPGSIALSEPFFAPFLQRFGLGADTILRTIHEHDPSPAAVRRAADGASGIRAIIVPSTTRDRLAEQLADARGWSIIAVDPIGLTYDDYVSWLSASVDSLLIHSTDP